MSNRFLNKDSIKKILIILLADILVGFAISCYIPNKIVSGGVSGIANILYHTNGLSAALTMTVINLLFALLALKKLKLKFLLPSFINAAIIGGVSDFFMAYTPTLTTNPLLAAIFGGVLYGLGLAICFTQGVSTGGTDILSRFFQVLKPNIKIGKVLLAVDAFIIIASLITFKQVDLALYGIIALFISTYTLDWFIAKLNISKLAFIVTDKGEEVARFLTATSPRGVTIIDAKGGYTMNDKKLLICALKSNEMTEFQRKILEIDSLSFIIFSESQQIIGNGFRLYF